MLTKKKTLDIQKNGDITRVEEKVSVFFGKFLQLSIFYFEQKILKKVVYRVNV